MSRSARAARWVWRGEGVLPALARAALLPFSAAYAAVRGLLQVPWDAGWRHPGALPAPSLGVGNLSVGGTGKTPLVGYLADILGRRGLRVGIVLRGYGGDETRELASALPNAVVRAGADRQAAAREAVAEGAEVLVLDDCLQRRDVAVTAMLATVAAETWHGNPWLLPAGPWREGPSGLRRADAVVVTAKTAGAAEAGALAAALARRTRGGEGFAVQLAPRALRPLAGGPEAPLESLHERDVLAVCGVGEGALFGAQLERAGARVRLLDFGDHHAFDPADVARIAALAGGGTVVTTAKDAVKLGPLWPADGPPCLVAELALQVTSGAAVLDALVDRVATAARPNIAGAAVAPPARDS